MKTLIIILSMLSTISIHAQNIIAQVVSYTGNTINSSNFTGATTGGETAISTGNSNNIKLYEGFHFLPQTSIYPGCLLVTKNSGTNEGSIYAAIECAENNDIIMIDNSLAGTDIFLSAPPIVIDKPLTLNGFNNRFRELSTFPTSLIFIISEVTIDGFSTYSTTGQKLIEVSTNGTLIWN